MKLCPFCESRLTALEEDIDWNCSICDPDQQIDGGDPTGYRTYQ